MSPIVLDSPPEMTLQPLELSLTSDNRLLITWSDGRRREYGIPELRYACPCATCREKRSQPPKPAPLLPVLTAAETRPLAILGMAPVGQYAYAIDFSDGHNTGIYTFDLLLELGTAA